MIKSSPDRTPLTSAQLRAARALIRWSAEDLARASAVGTTTIRRAELTESETSLTAANDLAIRRALEAAGVEFIDENGGGAWSALAQGGTQLMKSHSNLVSGLKGAFISHQTGVASHSIPRLFLPRESLGTVKVELPL